MKRRDWLSAALVSPAVTFPPIRTAEQDPLPQPESLSGTIRLLTQVFSERDVPADPEPIAKQIVLVGASGDIFPLISDEASRALFLDERLRDKPATLTVRRRPQLPWLQVVLIQIEHEGHPAIPEYYCDVCAISVRFPQICPCCQGSTVLRWKPKDP